MEKVYFRFSETLYEYLSVNAIKHSDKRLYFYTGLDNYNVFLHAYWSLGDNFDHLQYVYSERCDCISNETQFLSMLVNPFIPTVLYSGRITGFVSLF